MPHFDADFALTILLSTALAFAVLGIIARIIYACILAWRDKNGNGQIDPGE